MLAGEAILVLRKGRATANGIESRERTSRSGASLLAAGAFFALGVAGLLSVLPYRDNGESSPDFVTNPTQAPSANVRDARPAGTSLPGLAAEDVPSAAATAGPTAPPVAPVAAAGVASQGITGVNPQPDPPTPTPTPPPAAPTPASTAVDPVPSPTPARAPSFIPDSREPGPVKQADPVTAFVDPSFQQPAAVAPSTSGSYPTFPVTPGR